MRRTSATDTPATGRGPVPWSMEGGSRESCRLVATFAFVASTGSGRRSGFRPVGATVSDPTDPT
jgi:hypothetical protein